LPCVCPLPHLTHLLGFPLVGKGWQQSGVNLGGQVHAKHKYSSHKNNNTMALKTQTKILKLNLFTIQLA